MSQLEQIALADIGKSLFSTRFQRDDRPLQSSIQKFGVLIPPVLVMIDQEWRVVDGMARIEFAKECGIEKLACFVSQVESEGLGNTFLHCLELNRWSRAFNIVEKAFILKMAHEIYGGLNIPKPFWELADINQNIRAIHQYKELLKLSHIVQKYAVTNNIALTVILGFLRFPAAEVEKVASQLFILPLNQNKIAEILGLLLDISKREETSPGKIMDGIMAELENESSAMAKEQQLRRLLHKRRNPNYENQLSDFEKKIKDLGISAAIRVAPAPYFENDSIEISTTLHSTSDLNELIKSLQTKNWSRLFEN